MTDAELIRLLKAEIQDLQDQQADGHMPSVELLDDLNLERVKVRAMQEALNRSESVTEAARMLGIDRVTLARCIRRHGLKRPVFVQTGKWEAA